MALLLLAAIATRGHPEIERMFDLETVMVDLVNGNY